MEFFLPLILLHYKLSSSFRLIDNFSNHFSFHLANYIDKESKEAYFHKLDKIFKNTLTDSNTIIVISGTSIKNNVAISISHVYSNFNDIKKNYLPYYQHYFN